MGLFGIECCSYAKQLLSHPTSLYVLNKNEEEPVIRIFIFVKDYNFSSFSTITAL